MTLDKQRFLCLSLWVFKKIEENDDILNDFDHFNTTMIFRVAVRSSQNNGLSIIEYKPNDEKAAEEIKSLYEEVFNV